MDILENPFHILGATTRDDRQRIMELAEENSLKDSDQDFTKASSKLLNPRKRLSAEMGWLPGLCPKKTSQAITLLKRNPAKMRFVKNLPSLSKANLQSAAIGRLNNQQQAEEFAKWIIDLAKAYDEIKPEDMLMLINEDRTVSGFTEVSDISFVEEELSERRRYYKDAIKNALDMLAPKELINAVTIAVEYATNNGENHAPALIDDVVNSYEVETQAFLSKEIENIENLLTRVKEATDSNLPENEISVMISKLEGVVKNWDFVAQPIQLNMKGRGMDHELSFHVATEIRDLSLHLFNERGELELAQKLTCLVQEVFAEIPEVVEWSEKDADNLMELAEHREEILRQAKEQKEKWKNEIFYEAEIGLLFKQKLKISSEGIEWQGNSWPLESITSVRWGGTRRSVNGIPTGTSYAILIGSEAKNKHMRIETKRKEVFGNCVDRLWKAVGVRLLTEFLKGLKDGKSYIFGSTIVNDRGIELEKFKFVGPNDLIFCPWSELVIGNGAGTFYISKKNDKKLSMELSYIDDDNVHVFEAAMRLFWERGGDLISSLLESSENDCEEQSDSSAELENDDHWDDIEAELEDDDYWDNIEEDLSDETVLNESEVEHVIINETNTALGIEAEYEWIHKHFGEKGSDWVLEMRYQKEHGDRYIETFVLKLKDGRKISVDFDITTFFGKW